MKDSTVKIIGDLSERYSYLKPCYDDIIKAAEVLIASFRASGKLLCCGNGGSASDALHIVGELMKDFAIQRPLNDSEKESIIGSGADGAYIVENLQRALPAIALVGSTALESAYANDRAPDLAFAQQVFGLGNRGDVFLGITTSGNSKNVIYAAEVARAKGIIVIGLTGNGGGKIADLCDVCIKAPYTETYKIQECHLPIYHTLCLALENEFFGL